MNIQKEQILNILLCLKPDLAPQDGSGDPSWLRHPTVSRLSNETQSISFISTPIHILISEIGLESSSPPRNILLFGADSFQLPLQPWDHCEPPRAGGSWEYFILEEGGTEPTPPRFQTMEFRGVSSLAPDPAKSRGPGWNQHIPAEESCPTPKSNESGEVEVKSPQIPDPILQ